MPDRDPRTIQSTRQDVHNRLSKRAAREFSRPQQRGLAAAQRLVPSTGDERASESVPGPSDAWADLLHDRLADVQGASPRDASAAGDPDALHQVALD